MVLNTIKNTLLVLSAFVLTVTLGHYFLYEREVPNAAAHQYATNVQEQLNEAVENFSSELTDVATQLPPAGNKLVRNALPATNYPYFIFTDDQLVHWSDNSLVPSLTQVQGSSDVRVIHLSGGTYVALHKETANPRYAIYGLIPLLTSNELSQPFNGEIFTIQPSELRLTPSAEVYRNITSPDGTFLFSVQPPRAKAVFQPLLPETTLKILGIAALLFSLYCLIQLSIYLRNKQFGHGIILLAVFLLVARWLLTVNNVVLFEFHASIFEPHQVAGNRWALSTGDRLINAFTGVILLGYSSIYFYRSASFYRFQKSSHLVKSIYSVVSVVTVYLISYFLKFRLTNLLKFSSNRTDYSLNSFIDDPSSAYLTYFLLLSTVFFLGTHCCLYLFTKFQPHKQSGALHWIYGTILSLIILVIFDDVSWIYLVTGGYFILVYYFNLSRNFYIFNFYTSLYMLLAAFSFAVISVYVLSGHLDAKEKQTVETLGKAFFTKNDFTAEKWMNARLTEIATDSEIKQTITADVLAREKVIQLITDDYFPNSVNGYQTRIEVFDASGKNLDLLPDADDLPEVEQRLTIDASPTRFANLRLLTAAGSDYISYFGTAVIIVNGKRLGAVLVEFTSNQPRLESNRTALNAATSLTKEYSFALYDRYNHLIYSDGGFKYDSILPANALENGLPNYYTDAKQRYFSLKNNDGKTLLISIPRKGWNREWSNLSFLFFLSVLGISIVLIIYSFLHSFKKRRRMNFTTRIQLYLNSAFLLPLLIVLLIAISVVGATLKLNQDDGFRSSADGIAATVKLLLDDLKANRMSEAFFEQEISNLSNNTKTDFAIYGGDGIKQYGLQQVTDSLLALPNYLYPTAFYEIIEHGEQQILVTEQSSRRQVVSSFTGIDLADGEKTVLTIPYYHAKSLLTKQLTEVISPILNIFILVFILLLIASYFASRQLTDPLRTITKHLQLTNLDKLDEPLPLAVSHDEMGVLIQTYNRMLRKLEESKSALSTSEKQTAWREMAKQVAHEIKNPLTPMKLSIQQLQRTLPNENPQSKLRIQRTLNSLNEQIDNISEIATSFSEFAKMPVPRFEEFDIVEVIQKTADLYNTSNIDIHLQFSQPAMMVKGDRQLMSRMLTNLIINGLQSVAIDIRPEISVNLYPNSAGNYAIIEVKDNGTGIPEEIREKVFMPSFSTKVGGSGLGLAMAKRGIEHGGGNIWFETEVGDGTTFFVDLPMVR